MVQPGVDQWVIWYLQAMSQLNDKIVDASSREKNLENLHGASECQVAGEPPPTATMGCCFFYILAPYWRFVTWVISVLLKSSIHDLYMSYFGGLWSDQGHGSAVGVPYGCIIAARKPMIDDSLISDQGCWSGMANWGCNTLVPFGGMI